MANQEENIQEFVKLFTTHQAKINSYILTLVPNYSDSADIMQETAMMIWSKFPEFEVGSNFLSWGLSIAHYRVLEFRRKKKKINEIGISEDVLEKIRLVTQDKKDSSNEQIVSLKKCFTLLDKNDQQIILLRYHENLKLREVAEKMDKSLQSIYRRISRVQESLFKCVKKYSGEPGSQYA